MLNVRVYVWQIVLHQNRGIEIPNMEAAAIAELLMEYVRKDEVSKIEEMLKNGDSASWRTIIRYEFKIQEIMDTILKYEVSMKLISIIYYHYVFM